MAEMRTLAVYMIVAWRLLYVDLVARTHPDAPCTTFLQDDEWKDLWCHRHKIPVAPPTPPDVRTAVRWLAMLGGFLGRKRDGEPGVKTLWRGLRRLQDLVEMWRIMQPVPLTLSPASCGPAPPCRHRRPSSRHARPQAATAHDLPPARPQPHRGRSPLPTPHSPGPQPLRRPLPAPNRPHPHVLRSPNGMWVTMRATHQGQPQYTNAINSSVSTAPCHFNPAKPSLPQDPLAESFKGVGRDAFHRLEQSVTPRLVRLLWRFRPVLGRLWTPLLPRQGIFPSNLRRDCRDLSFRHRSSASGQRRHAAGAVLHGSRLAQVRARPSLAIGYLRPPPANFALVRNAQLLIGCS